MSKSTLDIPEKIKVGYQKRSGTYTGKLAYVTWIDHKGKMRKETSWNNWRHKKIDPDEFENEPTSGFVLNKKVGDYRSSWGGRQAWVRIYDPRGFEFEIDVENLLFILEECSAIKGKGLEGEFVYAWEGKNLVVLPVSSIDYQESVEYNNLKDKKVTKKDMTEGCVYLTKENEKVMYMGRHDFYEHYYGLSNTATKCHIFLPVDNIGKEIYTEKYESHYWTQKGFTKLAVKLTEDPDPNFADEFDRLMKSRHIDRKITKVITLPAKLEDEDYEMFEEEEGETSWYHFPCYKKHGDNWYGIEMYNCAYYCSDDESEESNGYEMYAQNTVKYLQKKDGSRWVVLRPNQCDTMEELAYLGSYHPMGKQPNQYRGYWKTPEKLYITKETFFKEDFVLFYGLNQHGQIVDRVDITNDEVFKLYE
jgi:hypothetical protein